MRLIEEARAINADADCSRRIHGIRLFGSVLTADQDSTVGDVDVVVDIARRVIPGALLTSIESAEERAKAGVNSASWIRCIGWRRE